THPRSGPRRRVPTESGKAGTARRPGTPARLMSGTQDEIWIPQRSSASFEMVCIASVRSVVTWLSSDRSALAGSAATSFAVSSAFVRRSHSGLTSSGATSVISSSSFLAFSRISGLLTSRLANASESPRSSSFEQYAPSPEQAVKPVAPSARVARTIPKRRMEYLLRLNVGSRGTLLRTSDIGRTVSALRSTVGARRFPFGPHVRRTVFRFLVQTLGVGRRRGSVRDERGVGEVRLAVGEGLAVRRSDAAARRAEHG